jgi:hypothetical protein
MTPRIGAFYLRRTVETIRYVFPAGKYVRAERDDDGSYRIWPPGQDFAYVVGIPRRMLRPVKRYRRRYPKPEAPNAVR